MNFEVMIELLAPTIKPDAKLPNLWLSKITYLQRRTKFITNSKIIIPCIINPGSIIKSEIINPTSLSPIQKSRSHWRTASGRGVIPYPLLCAYSRNFLTWFAASDHFNQRKYHMPAIKSRNGQQVHKGKHNAEKCGDIPKTLPVPYRPEKCFPCF
jgi:hypothetical protein